MRLTKSRTRSDALMIMAEGAFAQESNLLIEYEQPVLLAHEGIRVPY